MNGQDQDWLTFNEYPKHRIRIWGNAHGYYGEPGGWIYHESSDKPICHGWDKIYKANSRRIWVWWAERLSKGKENTK